MKKLIAGIVALCVVILLFMFLESARPSTIIVMALVSLTTVTVAMIGYFFPREIRNIVWVTSCLLFLIVAMFYTVRPFIVEHNTSKAIDALETHLEDKYPGESWNINDTDEYRLKSEVILHVTFTSESEIVYEYLVEDKEIEQVDLWSKSGESVYETGEKPQHYEE